MSRDDLAICNLTMQPIALRGRLYNALREVNSNNFDEQETRIAELATIRVLSGI
jgi:hypothetical protein